MSTRQVGNGRENLVAEMAEALGYAAFIARGSRGPVDIVCFQADRGPTCEIDPLILAPLVIQVGGRDKGSSRVLGELESAPRPLGSKCIVSKHLKGKNGRIRWAHHTRLGKFATLLEAVNGERLAREKPAARIRRAKPSAKKAPSARKRAGRAGCESIR